MHINEIVLRVNKNLAGESLEYHEMEPFLDSVIDDINAKLNSRFPVFSEFSRENFPSFYPNYNFFPETYIRKVVLMGAAYKFYVADEEGLQAAPMMGYDYQQNLFEMLRDYLDHVPYRFSKESIDPNNRIGSVKMHEDGYSRGDDRWLNPPAVDFNRLW